MLREQVIWVFFGLGNPGSFFLSFRHNLGKSILRALKKRFSYLSRKEECKTSIKEKKIKEGRVSEFVCGSKRIFFFSSGGFMNNSGENLNFFLNRFLEENSLDLLNVHLLVLYDDMDLPLGRAKLSERRSSSTHFGVASIIEELGSIDFSHLRIGIGRWANKEERAQWLLSSFSQEELSILHSIQSMIFQLAEDWMNKTDVFFIKRRKR